MALRILGACALAALSCTPLAAQQTALDVSTVLPAGAVLKQQMGVDFEGDHDPETVLVYSVPSDKTVYHTDAVRVLQRGEFSEPEVVFEADLPDLHTHDGVSVEKLTTDDGKEALLKIALYSGAGTAKYWSVAALVEGRIVELDPQGVKMLELDARGYEHMGYNGVRAQGDRVIETIPGYSPHRARCCPNRPTLEITFRFTGSEIVIESVEELPYGVPESGRPGPLLRLNHDRFWAYGYQVDDGFLVLGGSEAATRHARSTPREVVALRQELLDSDVLWDAEQYLMFGGSHEFTSASIAAGVILGRRADATEWQDKDGAPLGANTSR